MLFSRIASCLTFALTLGILAVANPVELESRANVANVESVVTTLKSKADTIVPQIKSVAANPRVSAATVAPLINELVAALNTAQNSLTQVKFRELKERQADDAVANTFAGVVTDIVGAVNLLPKGLPGLAGLIFSLDFALAGVIKGLDVVLIGAGFLLGGLLKGVAGLLIGLGFGLTFGLLGL